MTTSAGQEHTREKYLDIGHLARVRLKLKLKQSSLENKAAAQENGKQLNRFMSRYLTDVTFKCAHIFYFYIRVTNRWHKAVRGA